MFFHAATRFFVRPALGTTPPRIALTRPTDRRILRAPRPDASTPGRDLPPAPMQPARMTDFTSIKKQIGLPPRCIFTCNQEIKPCERQSTAAPSWPAPQVLP